MNDNRKAQEMITHSTFARHSEGFIFPVYKFSRVSPLLERGIEYLSMIHSDLNQAGYNFFLTNTDGCIDSVSLELKELFSNYNIKIDDSNNPVSIFKLCKQLEPIYKILNSKYNNDNFLKNDLIDQGIINHLPENLINQLDFISPINTKENLDIAISIILDNSYIVTINFQNFRKAYDSKRDASSASLQKKYRNKNNFIGVKTGTATNLDLINTFESDIQKMECRVYDVQYSDKNILRVVKVSSLLQSKYENSIYAAEAAQVSGNNKTTTKNPSTVK